MWGRRRGHWGKKGKVGEKNSNRNPKGEIWTEKKKKKKKQKKKKKVVDRLESGVLTLYTDKPHPVAILLSLNI